MLDAYGDAIAVPASDEEEFLESTWQDRMRATNLDAIYFFYGHKGASATGVAGPQCLSNWFTASFVEGDNRFSNSVRSSPRGYLSKSCAHPRQCQFI